MTTDPDTIRVDFITLMGQSLAEHGFSPIAGRILGLLIHDGESRSFSDLATGLGVSRGSISANARILVARGAIEKVNRPGDRQDYFRSSEDTSQAMLAGVQARMRDTAARVRRLAAALPEGEGARDRMLGLADFQSALAEALGQAALKLCAAPSQPG